MLQPLVRCIPFIAAERDQCTEPLLPGHTLIPVVSHLSRFPDDSICAVSYPTNSQASVVDSATSDVFCGRARAQTRPHRHHLKRGPRRSPDTECACDRADRHDTHRDAYAYPSLPPNMERLT